MLCKNIHQLIKDFKSDIGSFYEKFKFTKTKNVFYHIETNKYYYIDYDIEVGEPPHFINDYTINNIYEVEPYETKTIAFRKI